eukprot:Rhum_TRINITY_DN14167_c2_g2::Rhum_TRINITY_DN14167_c2_g2_i4::g.69730::m.69730
MGATPRTSAAHAEAQPLSWSVRWVTRDRLALGVIAVAMWTVCVVITAHLCVTYTDSGRKEKTALQNIRLQEVEMPSVVVLDAIGARCGCVMTGCFFSQFRPTRHGGAVERACDEIVTQRSTSLYGEYSEAHILNQTKARRDDFVFRTLLDYVAVDFKVVRYNNDSTTTPVTDVSECGRDWQGGRSVATTAMLVPITDEKLINDDNRDPRLDTTDLGTPVYAGLNHQSLLSFRLSQEHFVDGRVTNTVSFKNTQYDPAVQHQDPGVTFSLVLQADSFEVQQVKHIAGESLFALMGAVFGWVSALTGASVQGVLVAAFIFHHTRPKAAARSDGGGYSGLEAALLQPPSSSAAAGGQGRETPTEGDDVSAGAAGESGGVGSSLSLEAHACDARVLGAPEAPRLSMPLRASPALGSP